MEQGQSLNYHAYCSYVQHKCGILYKCLWSVVQFIPAPWTTNVAIGSFPKVLVSPQLPPPRVELVLLQVVSGCPLSPKIKAK